MEPQDLTTREQVGCPETDGWQDEEEATTDERPALPLEPNTTGRFTDENLPF